MVAQQTFNLLVLGSTPRRPIKFGSVALMAERLTVNQEVVGSNPT